MRKLPVLMLLVLSQLVAALPAKAADLSVSREGDSYLVSGSLLLHDSTQIEGRPGSRCSDCHWKFTVICRSWQGTAHGSCPFLLARCPSGWRLAEVWRSQLPSRPLASSDAWVKSGYTCFTDEGPLTVHEVTTRLQQLHRVGVPPLKTRTSPPSTTVTFLPTFVQFVSVRELPVQHIEVVGIPIEVRRTSSAYVSCGRCSLTSTSGMVFTSAGPATVTVNLLWNTGFHAEGFPDLDVGLSPIRQRTTHNLTVIPLHRRLTTRSSE